jgi:hypothetical protein
MDVVVPNRVKTEAIIMMELIIARIPTMVDPKYLAIIIFNPSCNNALATLAARVTMLP